MADGVRLALVGDVFLGPEPHWSVSQDVAEILAGADLVVANQEGPISVCATPVADKCSLNSAPDAAAVLRNWGVNVATLANNHMFDFGVEGFEQTCRALDDVGIQYLGAGHDLAEATTPLIVSVKGLRLGLLTFSWGFVQTTCATAESPGCAPLDEDLMLEATRRLAAEVDVVIVLPHWGYCEYHYPLPTHLDLGRRLLDAGATAVVGHHSHVVQGVVSQEAGLIAASLGNFLFADYSDRGRPVPLTRENRRGMILELHVSCRQVVSHRVHLTVVRDGQISLESSRRRAKSFQKRSAMLACANYPRYWRRYVRWRAFRRLLHWANPLNWRKIHRGTFLGAWIMLKSMVTSRSSGQTETKSF